MLNYKSNRKESHMLTHTHTLNLKHTYTHRLGGTSLRTAQHSSQNTLHALCS